MQLLTLRILLLSLTVLAALPTAGAERSYYAGFLDASKQQKGFLWDTSLVETNNSGPALTNASLSFSRFAEQGELAGVRLGMTMSEVVAAWGKPRRLFTHCFVGPRFWYGFGLYGDLTLYFIADRLAIIRIDGPRVEHLAFDNGLTGRMSRTECEQLLGPPVPRNSEASEVLYSGDISYRARNIRTDLAFSRTSQESASSAEHLTFMGVSLEQEAMRKKAAAPDAAPKAAPPHR